jgi:hypothetical protein
MALLYEGGVRRVAVLLIATTLVLSVLSAGAGAILWLVFGQETPHGSVVRWVLRNTTVWTAGFVGSVIIGLAIAVAIPGVNADSILGIGGFATGLAAGKWVRDVAEEYEPAREMSGELQSLDLRPAEEAQSTRESYGLTRTDL